MSRHSIARRLWFITIPLGLLGALLLVLAIEAGTGQPRTVIYVDGPQYQDLASLKRDSDVAIRATVVSTSQFQVPGSNIPTTRAEVQVTRILFSKQTSRLSVGTTVGVIQTGGSVNGSVVEVNEDPLFVPGEKMILFLHFIADNNYYVKGGPSGRFEVGSDGRVRSVNGNGIAHGPDYPTTGEFISQVERS